MSASGSHLCYDEPPPSALVRRMDELMREFSGARERYETEDYLGVGEALLGRLLREGCTTRGAAMDLLVADALITRAFELASEEPGLLQERAQGSMVRLAALAAGRA